MPSQNTDPIVLTEQQLYDYMNCPLLYYLKYRSKINIPEHITMHRHIITVMKYFLNRLHEGTISTLKELQRKWDGICKNEKNGIDRKHNIAGWEKIVKFAQWAQKNQIAVGDVNVPYSINVQNVTLKGNIEQILVNPNTRKIELFFPNFTEKEFTQYSLDTNLKYTIDAYAFRQLFKDSVNGIHIYSAKLDKDYYTYRNDKDFAKLKTTIYNIGNSIQNNYFYGRESVLCESCPGKAYCKYWSMPIV